MCPHNKLLQEAVQWLEKSSVEGKDASMASLAVRVAHTQRFVAAKEAAPQQAVVLLTGLMQDMQDAGPEGCAVTAPDLLGGLAEAHYRAGQHEQAFGCVEQMLGVAGGQVDVSEHVDVGVLKAVLEEAGLNVDDLLH